MERHIVLGVCLLLIVVQLNPAASQISQPESTFTQPPSVADSGDNFLQTDGLGQDSEPPDTSPAPPPPNDETSPVDVYTPEWDGSSISETDDSYLANLQTEDATTLTLGGGAREGYFTTNSVVLLPLPINLRGYTSISFRTCLFGTLLSQSGSGGDALSLAVSEEGSLVLKLNHRGQETITTLGKGLNDNAWHRAYLRFELGILTLGVDQETVVIANTTSNSSSLIDLGLLSPEPRLRIGANFTGCILQGAGTELTTSLIKHSGVDWNNCPLPDGTDCSGYDEDQCFSQPCGRHGVCTSTPEGPMCTCYTRYSGKNCEGDSGPLCHRPEFQCLNQGMCQEDRLGNSTYCACPVGFTGPICEIQIDDSFCDNDDNPCRNNATCTVNAFGDIYECQCQPGFSGEHCEINDDNCISQPCWHGGICIDKVNSFECDCEGTGYDGDICETNIDECLLLDPCTNGATCFDLYGDYECACTPGYSGKHCEVEVQECSSNPCQNGGSCTDLKNGYRCSCILGFEGDNCEHNIDDCFNVTCPENSQAVDFINECMCRCKPGFSGFPPDCIEIDECNSSPCLNEGTCYDAENAYTCSCPQGYSGANCEINNDDCSPNPCHNGGTCEDGIDNYVCTCPPGFFGDYCEENLDECSLNVCTNFVTCNDLDYFGTGDYECVCLEGWTGKNCDIEIDECASSPCQNGATCQDGLNRFICICPAGFTGELCSSDIDDCVENPCLNGGLCIDGINNYTCDCLDAFMGRNCEEEYDGCASNPCHNSATCTYNRDTQEYSCECVLGFEGQLCQNNINDCVGVECSLGKVCVDLVNNYECHCPAGFTGENCTENVDECESSPCLNNGECLDGLAHYSCVCPAGYTGYSCEEDIDECETLKPCVNGICQNVNGSYQCYCQPGYSGDHCNLEFDECLSRPCRNGGHCINEINGYKCVCEPGFTGTDCDIDIDECASDPCQNNATCYDDIANFTCECLPGFTDLLCSTNIDECESEPCMNGGACTDGINNYTCNCDNTGFKGDQCEINIDDCESSPCQHGSTCSDLIKDYVCECYDGYEGKNCENDILECQTFPCQNDATCLERSNLTLYEINIFSNFSYETAGGFVCECVPGFTGDYCEINIDECASDPCINGNCIDGINAYSCECSPGYEGSNCETEIDECDRFQPCVYGTCVDKVADYDCECDDGYGGKNCSVELIGCNNRECMSGGFCEALLHNETIHDYKCHCEHGFTGRNCENSTTMSFAGKSHVLINSKREGGYDLSFRFRTTLPSGVLAVVQGKTYAILQLLNGQLNLYSPILQELPDYSGDGRLDGIFTGSHLNDGQWQEVRMTVNESYVVLAANDQETVHPGNPSQIIESSATVLGGATSTLAILLNGAPFFTGCIEDVFVDGSVIIPSDVPSPMKIAVEEGCPREEQCSPNPCMNDGECKDMWTSFLCNCQRPYLGDTCELSFTPATFGNEDILDSLVTVIIPEVDHATYRTHADVSMLVRTREPDGLIFYLGTPLDADIPGLQDKHLLAQLVGGDLVLRVLLDGPEERFNISNVVITDGDPHLLHVKRINNEVEVYVDNGQVLNSSLLYGGNLDAQVLYLGGVPDNYHSRFKRQLGVSNFTTTVTRIHFKGILQDIRLSNGTETRLVQPFPLENVSSDLLPGLDLEPADVHGVLEGVVSDNTCNPDPCQNGATCTVTWNDFNCTCTFGFKGKTCEDREYCALYQCPAGSECINLDDGYECVANLTLNGVNSSISFSPEFGDPPAQINDVSINYRSQVGGVVFSARAVSGLVWIGITQSSIVVHQESGLITKTSYFTSNVTLDGNWHLLKVTFTPSGLQVILGDVSLLGTDSAVIVDFASIITNGQVQLGSSHTLPTSLSLLDPSLVISTATPENAIVPEQPHVPQVFRGCVGEIRIQGILMPYFSEDELINNTAANTFRLEEQSNLAIGCTVCFNHECLNDGFCADPSEIYTCSCLLGFEGEQCQINIDECIGNTCTNGATCVDEINQYTCSCMPGYTGQHCEEDINECASSPCKNGGICLDEIALFVCQCPEDFIGSTCEELKIKNCSNNMCKNGATCNDVYNPLTGVADNYNCTCPFGYSGVNCDEIEDFCTRRSIMCAHGLCIHTFHGEGWECKCNEGWQGALCEEPTNECIPNPCYNGGTCLDSHLSFTCMCPPQWNGTTCEEDVDECEKETCENGGHCINKPGFFTCECNSNFCGQHCRLINPCISHNCSNDGQCMSLCDETLPAHQNRTRAFCECPDGWGGEYCLDEVFPSDVDLAIIVGCVVGLMLISAIVGLTVFLMMAKKKRQTRGTYSPSRQEFYSPRVEMGNIMKPPPEERLI